MAKKIVTALLICSAALNGYWWFTFHRTVPLHAICWHNSNIYHLFGNISDDFGDKILSHPGIYSPQVYVVGTERSIHIPAYQISEFWGGSAATDILLNFTGHALRAKSGSKEYFKQGNSTSCGRAAQWLFKPVGKAKNIKCSRLECRIIGLKKESDEKK